MRNGDVRVYGGIGDGKSHQLATLFSSFGAARAVHPWLRSDAWTTVEADYAAARTAIAASAVNREVFFPAGAWIMSGGLTLSASGVSVYGEGSSTNLRCSFRGDAKQDFLLAANGLNDIVIRDLTISGTSAGAIGLQHGSGCRVLRCDISGVTLPNSTGFCTGILLQDVVNAEVDRCTLHGNGSEKGEGHCDIFANGGTYRIRSSRITNNRCLSTLVNSNIALFDPLDVVVSGNEVSGAIESPVDRGRQGYGICLYHTVDMRDPVGNCDVTDNNVHDVRGSGIYAQDVPRCNISNNTVRNSGAGQGDATLAVAGIVVEGRDSVCRGNVVADSKKCGICVTISAFGSIVRGNVVRDSAYDGIALRNVISDVVVADNLVENSARVAVGSFQALDVRQARITISANHIRRLTKPGVAIAIFAPPGSRDWQVVGNQVTGANGRAFSIAGTGHRVSDNRAEGKLWP